MLLLTRLAFAFLALLAMPVAVSAAEKEKPVKVVYRFTPPAPREQTAAQMAEKSDGCYSCHVQTDQPTMHKTPAVRAGLHRLPRRRRQRARAARARLWPCRQ